MSLSIPIFKFITETGDYIEPTTIIKRNQHSYRRYKQRHSLQMGGPPEHDYRKLELMKNKKMELKDYGDSTGNSPGRWCKW